jgi:hypothetical protein
MLEEIDSKIDVNCPALVFYVFLAHHQSDKFLKVIPGVFRPFGNRCIISPEDIIFIEEYG